MARKHLLAGFPNPSHVSSLHEHVIQVIFCRILCDFRTSHLHHFQNPPFFQGSFFHFSLCPSPSFHRNLTLNANGFSFKYAKTTHLYPLFRVISLNIAFKQKCRESGHAVETQDFASLSTNTLIHEDAKSLSKFCLGSESWNQDDNGSECNSITLEIFLEHHLLLIPFANLKQHIE